MSLRFACSAITTLSPTSTAVVQLADVSTWSRIWNSLLLPRKSEPLFYVTRRPRVHTLHVHFSVKRQTQQKKRKERERKELDALGRRHFANVRVVQRNVVYVVGLGPRLAKEEVWYTSYPAFSRSRLI
jgi:hypothetical protein